ncbi:BREX-1 system adenine-specific DNA-methyltransferase PglX [Shewanella putrefaciens]|uniref:BREX-1 system adenine-specific DNA-methyltransferase PglX n=1 Tax=Shewanella putrefaciens TaxID=24 RepID=UPI003565998F
MSQQQNNDMQQHFYRASAADFKKVPGSPIAYWLSNTVLKAFENTKPLSKLVSLRKGLTTMDNNRFLRRWYECSLKVIRFDSVSAYDAKVSGAHWFPINKGGGDRKWYGLNDFLINWENDGIELKRHISDIYSGQSYTKEIRSEEHYFKKNITWSTLSSSSLSLRYTPAGSLFESKGSVGISNSDDCLHAVLSFGNSKVINVFLGALSPTIDFNAGPVGKCPIFFSPMDTITRLSEKLISIAKTDWDSYELSWDFSCSPLLYSECSQKILKVSYQEQLVYRNEIIHEMQRLEEENNKLFIEAYGLQDELTSEVPLSEITLTCNPHYRYGGNLTDEEREARLQSDTLCELISYAIGCMMGRYSLDREGLVYAHAGNEGFKALVDEGAYSTFTADDDGILPLTSENWFEDDVAARIEQFVASVWGNENLEENLNFIADSLCLYAIKPVKKGGETARETIRRYLSSQFYKDHLKTYKKRPIYWLFSSGKEKAFECLVYLHRYNESTLPRMRTEYVTPLLGQMASRIERKRMEQTEASTAEAKRIGKEIDSLNKQLTELRAFDDQLKHHADMRITLDLDDGVKVNYGKFGTLLSDVKAITGDKGE